MGAGKPPKLTAGRSDRGVGKTRLSAALIIAAGLELAERPGTTSISVRELGASLGADPTAIYRHFRNKDELVAALLDELFRRSVDEVSAPIEDWKNRLRELSASTLNQFVHHPAIAVEAVVLTTGGPGERDAIELMLEAFSHACLSDSDTVRHYALLASHVLFVGAGIASGRGESEAGARDAKPWFDGPVRANPVTHPRIEKFGHQISGFGDRELFLLGVETVIESAERAVQAAAGS